MSKKKPTLYIEENEYKEIKKYMIDKDIKSLNSWVLDLIRREIKKNGK